MSCIEILEKLAYDRVSSSNQIALKMIDCAIELFDSEPLGEYMEKMMKTQSGMAVVLNVADRICKAKSKDELKRLKFELLKAEESAIDEAYEHIKGAKNIATISFSNSVLKLLKMIKPQKVYLSISHPAREGELLAENLMKEGIEVVLFEDAAYSLVMRDVEISIIGADAVFDDAVVNKIGSYALALLSREFDVPFYVVANKFKLLSENLRNFYKILRMDKSEISNLNCDVLNVYFEHVPVRLVKKIFMG
ncbi:hypothetical protein [Hippea alviniae]|uniref:hypothetical protein n=1 Tax=Hippea alviniae TaxID=1279027 RepID=UPI0003B2F515|nr:hypothetical protein [Hippea alviniae]